MTDDQCTRLSAYLEDIVTNQTELLRLTGIAIELHHEWLDRPPPEMRHTVNIPAWSKAQIERMVTIYLDVRDKVLRERGHS